MKSKTLRTKKKTQTSPPVRVTENEFVWLYRIAQVLAIGLPSGFMLLLSQASIFGIVVAAAWAIFSSIRMHQFNKMMAKEYAKRGRR